MVPLGFPLAGTLTVQPPRLTTMKPLEAFGWWKITMNVVSVASIYKGVPAICPHDVIWEFLQSSGASDDDLHQPWGIMDICIGMDCDFLQPKHLEQKMCGSHLHLYTSVFGGWLILPRVEPLEVQESEDLPVEQPVEALEEEHVQPPAEQTMVPLEEEPVGLPAEQHVGPTERRSL